MENKLTAENEELLREIKRTYSLPQATSEDARILTARVLSYQFHLIDNLLDDLLYDETLTTLRLSPGEVHDE